MTQPSQPGSPPRYLLVETEAHVPHGHSAPYLRELTKGFRTAGVEPTVLTAQGWHPSASDESVPQRVFAPAARWLDARARAWRSAGSRLAALAGPVQQLASLAAIRREAGTGAYDAVVILASCVAPEVLLAGAPREGARWGLSVRRAPHPRESRSRIAQSLDAALRDLGERAQAARLRTGRGLVLAPVSEELSRAWSAWGQGRVPVRTITAAISDAVPVRERRAGGSPLALFFGYVHPSKDPVTVWRAFRDPLDDVTLHAAGVGVAASAEAELGPTPAPHVVLEDGYVEPARMADLFARADVVVLSFPPGQQLDSGVLTNAIAAGAPVVCSAPSSAAALVESLGVGTTFAAGDPDSLRAAVRTVLADPPTQAIAAAQARAAEQFTAGALAALWVGLMSDGPDPA